MSQLQKDNSLRITTRTPSGRAWLYIIDSILLFHKKQLASESVLMMPIEEVNFNQYERFYKDYLCLAILIPIIAILLSTVFALSDSDNTLTTGIFYALIISFFLEICLLLAIPFKSFMSNKTVGIISERHGIWLEFWKERKNTQEIDGFLGRLNNKILGTANMDSQNHRPAFSFFRSNNLMRLFAFMLFCCLPSIFTGKMLLLMICIIPVVWYITKIILLRKNNQEVAQAVKNYNSSNWPAVISELESTKEVSENNFIPILLLVDAYIRTQRLEEAWETANRFPKALENKSFDLPLSFWKWQTIHLRRMEPASDEEIMTAKEFLNKKE